MTSSAAGKPPFRADHVGSLLRPPVLKEARRRHAQGSIDTAALRAVEDAEIVRVIAKQQAIGLRSVTDGEFRRSWWHLDFLWGLDGVGKHTLESSVPFAGASTRLEGVRVEGPLGFSGHPMLADFQFLQENTQRVPKLTLPSPSAIYGRPARLPIDPRTYATLDAFFADLGRTYAAALGAFAAAGCRYLQLDEVFLAMLCDSRYRQTMTERGDDSEKLAETYADLVNVAVADLPADVTVTMHLCRGNFKSTFMGSGSYEAVQEVLFHRVNVHGYFMEYDDERSGGFEPLRLLPKDKRVALGIVTTKRGALEEADFLKRRIDEAAGYVDLDRLCVAPQCGFASTEEGNLLSEDEQWAKLERIVEVADDVWGNS